MPRRLSDLSVHLSLTTQLEKIREIAVVLEEWVPPGEDEADEAAVLDEMDAMAAQPPLPTAIPEEQEEQDAIAGQGEEEEGVAVGDAAAAAGVSVEDVAADVAGQEEGAEGAEDVPKLPDYEELLPPAPGKEGVDATATELNGDGAVSAVAVAVETAPAAGSDVLVEETKTSPVPA